VGAVLLERIVETSDAVAATRSRLAKVERLADCLGGLAPGEIEAGVAFLAGQVRQGRIGVGYATVRGVTTPPAAAATLTVHDVDQTLSRIAGVTGPGSAREREGALAALLASATANEQRFLGLLLVGELRQGAQEGVLVEAIARASRLPAADVRRAVMLAGTAGPVAVAALSEGAPGLARFRLQPLSPVQPMLASTGESFAGALDGLGSRAIGEYKLDGARVQVHRLGDEVRVFSRQLNDVTSRVPEIVEAVRALPAHAIVLDGEALAFRPDGRPHSFQTTMRRFGRRLDVEHQREEMPLGVAYFDLLHLDGDDVIDRGTEARWRVLTSVVPEGSRIARREVADADAVEAFAREALAAGHEGVMLKAIDAPYEAGRRGSSWLKLKPAHTLDLVVLAVEWGSGRRRGWLSNLHLGARDPSTGGFVMLGKTFKGMTDDMLRWQTEHLLTLEIGRQDHVVHVRPELVVEIAVDGVQSSPHYPGGVALRFARVKRYRTDKRAEEASTIEEVRGLWSG
jgi:DNA ligase-1